MAADFSSYPLLVAGALWTSVVGRVSVSLPPGLGDQQRRVYILDELLRSNAFRRRWRPLELGRKFDPSETYRLRRGVEVIELESVLARGAGKRRANG